MTHAWRRPPPDEAAASSDTKEEEVKQEAKMVSGGARTAEDYLRLGKAAVNRSQINKAIAAFREAIRIDL